MPRVCPRPCSRLATAAVFISVGVVQFVVGIILLRSKYVYLLAGPDFWTSSCNIAVGCLLGTSAGVWKQSRKRQSKKHVLRRNLLLSLLFSAFTLNATTLGMLLLGEGNTLLSIRLESGGKYSDSTFASEVLAYAYVTSVCCPIVCIVVSIVSISGSCFKYTSRKNSKGMKTPQNSIKENSRALKWIYTPELLDLSRKKIRDLLSSSAESSSEDELDTPIHQKYIDSAEDVQCVLSRMAHGKRDSILRDSTIMLKQLDLRRKNRYNSVNQDGSYIGPEILRSREATVNERNYPEDGSLLYNDSLQRMGKSKRDLEDVNGNSRLPLEVVLKRANYSKSKQLDTLLQNPHTSEELVNEFQSASSQLSKHFPSQYRKYRERSQKKSDVDGPTLSCVSDVADYGPKSAPIAHKLVKMSEPPSMIRSVEYISQKPSLESSTSNPEVIEENELKRYETSSRLNACPSPVDLESDEDVMFDVSTTSSWAGEIVPIKLKPSSVARLSDKLIPVPSPVVPVILKRQEVSKISDDSGIGVMESNSFIEATGPNDFKDRKSNLSSFREDSKFGSQENKTCAQMAKKQDSNKIPTMASISEEPNSELQRPKEKTSSHDEVINISKSHSRKKSLAQQEISKVTNQDNDNSGKNFTPKRKNASGRSLKKIWSIAVAENQPADFLDQVVDEDSLIGLSEEELIARQLRTRSIRRAIQQRIKEEIAV